MILHGFYGEVAVCKGDVFNQSILPADYLGEITSVGGDSGKADVLKNTVAIIRMHDDTYRCLFHRVHDNIMNAYIFDNSIVSANISGVGMVRQFNFDSIAGMGNHKIGKSTVSDSSVITPCNTHSLTDGTEDAPPYNDPFTGAFLGKGVCVCSNNDAVITGVDYATFHQNVAGAVDVDTVRIWIHWIAV